MRVVAKKQKQTLKGFIGPIGFDLPSIMPIVFATIIFFSAVSYSYSTVNEKNNMLDSIESSIQIADVLKGDSYLEFDTTDSGKKNELPLNCAKAINIAQSKNINFAATFINLDSPSDIENLIKNKTSEIPTCNNNEEDIHLCWCGFAPKPFESNLSKKYWSISFPVTVDVKLNTG
ncbi:MAG: hypothetical protein KAS30_03510, partial [Candidatus Diapherotrites archaeon]|nr:hypothetical protein [Candidatus Diapherotrites archaeon]